MPSLYWQRCSTRWREGVCVWGVPTGTQRLRPRRRSLWRWQIWHSRALPTSTARPGREVLAALEAACRARLVEEVDAQTYRFVHDVIREVLEGDLSVGRQALLHGDIAAALEAAGGEPPVEALAYHYTQAGE